MLSTSRNIISSDATTQKMIAPVIDTLIATRVWSVGEEFIYAGILYKVTTAIAIGDQIVLGSGGNADTAETITKQIEVITDLTNSIEELENTINDLKTYTNDLRALDIYSSVSITASSAMSANRSIYYNGLIFKFAEYFTTVAGEYTCSIIPYGTTNYQYLSLGTISDANVKKVFPYIASTVVSLGLGYFQLKGTANLYACYLYRQSEAASTWYFCCSKYRVSQTASSKKITIETEALYTYSGMQFKTPVLPNPQ